MKYTLIKEKFIKEINSKVSLYLHNQTKAHICTISNDDNNKVFTIGFKTPAYENTGLTHILEHSVLCGSRKYNVKDPFVELSKGSLNTYLNAITFADKTLFPYASTNLQDFKNLTDVYLDAVFYPNIYKYKEIFYQEGHHLNILNKNDELTYNGVVYNEMKGAYSNPEQKLTDLIMESLFKDTNYRFNSGGNPLNIVDLTYDEFINYHKKYYHPSNSFIYLYGNLDFTERLNYLDENYLSNFSYREIDNKTVIQKPYDKPINVIDYYEVSVNEKLENRTFLTYNVCLKDNKNQKELLAISLIISILFKVEGAPLTKKIIDNKLAEDVYVSFNSDILQPVISITLVNSNYDKKDDFIKLIDSSIKEYINTGLPHKDILNLMDFNEFKLRESYFSSNPLGLNYIITSFSSILYDNLDPFSSLCYIKHYTNLREDINNNYFEDLLAKTILYNNHKSYVALIPKVNIIDKEKEILKGIKEKLSEEEIENLIKFNQDLIKFKTRKEDKKDLDSIPKLKKEDLNYLPTKLNLEVIDAKYPLTFSNYFTNDINYISYLFDLSNFNEEDLKYTFLLTNLLLSIDTKNYNYQELNQLKLALTGSFSYKVNTLTKKDNTYKVYLIINFSYLNTKAKEVFELVKEVSFNTIFKDDKRLEELLKELKATISYSLADGSVYLALNKALACFNEESYINDLFNGISSYNFIKELCDNYDKLKNQIINKLERIYSLVFNKKHFRAHITANDISSKDYIDCFFEKLKDNDYNSKIVFKPNLKNIAYTTTFDVNYNVLAAKYSNKYQDYLSLLENIINYDYLWPKIRALGGAYGAMLITSKENYLVFASYSDPHIHKTIEAFKNVVDFIEHINCSEDELLKYKIGVIGSKSFPLHVRSMGSKAFFNYLKGYSYDDFVKQRKAIIDCDVNKLKELNKLFKEALANSAICVIGAKEKIEENKELFDDILELK